MIVTVVWATPLLQDVVEVELNPGATLADALRRSGFVLQYGLDTAAVAFARHGVRAPAHAQLADGDRVEITRSLVVEPALARSRRARAKAAVAGASRSGRRTVK